MAAPDGGGGGTESAHWQTTVVGSQAGGWSWLIFDPAAPASGDVRLTVSGYASVLSQRSVDPVARTVTEMGDTLAFITTDGKLWRADLRGGQRHQPVVVSALTDACSVDQVLPLNAAGDEAWLVVSVYAGQADCSTRMLVRSSWDSSHAAIALGSTRLLTALADDSGQAQALLAAVPAPRGTGEWLQAYDTGFQPLPSLALPAGVSSVNLPAYFIREEGAQAGTGYVSANGQVRRLRWSAAGVSLDDGALYSFEHPAQMPQQVGPAALSHSAGLYLADGPLVVDVASTGGGTVLATLQDGEEASAFARTSGHLVFSSNVDYVAHYVRSVPLTGGATTLLMDGYMTHLVDLVGVAGDWVLTAISGGSLAGITYTRSLPDGSQKSEIGDPRAGVGRVLAAASPIGGRPEVHSLLACTPPTPSSEEPCGPGALQEIDARSLAAITLGSLGASASHANGDALVGMPGLVNLRNSTSTVTDTLVFQPGVAGSLQRITSNLP